MYRNVVAELLKKYGISNYKKILPKQSGYRNEIYPVVVNDGSVVQLTFYKNEPGILERVKRANQVSEYLAARGMPTRVRLDNRISRLSYNNKVIYAGLYNYLSGNTIPWESYTRKHIKTLGKTMSDMHSQLKNLEIKDNVEVVDEYLSVLARMSNYFRADQVNEAIKNKLKISLELDGIRYSKLLEGCRGLKGKQQLHMDFVRGNILFDDQVEPKITGILDFEKTAYGHPIIDVARSLAFLLVDCKFKETSEVWRLFIHSGYQKQGAAKLPTTGLLLDRLVEFFLIYDFYKFLRHNPYEFLHQNEHFIRTKALLLRRGVIKLG